MFKNKCELLILAVFVVAFCGCGEPVENAEPVEPVPVEPKTEFQLHFEKLKAIEKGSFREKEAYLASLIGKEVRWVGWVDGVENNEALAALGSPSPVALTLVPVPEHRRKKFTSDLALIFFPVEFLDRLLDLSNGDKIEVTAVLEKNLVGSYSCRGISFRKIDDEM